MSRLSYFTEMRHRGVSRFAALRKNFHENGYGVTVRLRSRAPGHRVSTAWTPSSLFLAELCHVGYGIVAVLLGYLLGFGYFWPAVVWSVVTLAKEARLDPAIEKDQPFFWAGAEDWLFWLVGTWAAFALFASGVLPR